MNRLKLKLLSILLAILMVIGIFPGISYAAQFSDMPDDWSRAALENAVENGLLSGYGGNIMPKDKLTRAQLAAIVNRAFGATEKESLDGYTDVDEAAWYYSDMAKAVHMKLFIGSNNKLDPEGYITREEAFTVISRALKLSGADEGVLDKFSDKPALSLWAKDPTASLAAAGYISGSKGCLNPQAGITRAEMAQLMDNIVKRYISKTGTFTGDTNGSVTVNVPGAVLKDMKIAGDLIVGDGVGDGDITLDNVIVTGRALIRGGGANSIKIKGNSSIGSIIIARVNGQVRVYAEDGTETGEMVVDGNDDVIIEGNVKSITVKSSGIIVTGSNGRIASCIIEGSDVGFIAGKGAIIDRITINGRGAAISGEGKVTEVYANANDLTVSTVGTKVIAAPGLTGVTAGTTVDADGKTNGVTGSSRPSRNEYRLNLVSKPENKGIAKGSGSYRKGAKISLTAEAGENYKFAAWTSNGKVISTEAFFEYIMPNSSTTLVANFVPTASVPVVSVFALQSIAEAPDEDYIQVGDIDLDVSPYNEDNGWIPIGDYDNRFTGSYKGNGYKIRNLFINDEYLDSAGLFGVIEGAQLEDVDLEDIDVSAHVNVGGLVGTSLDGCIRDSNADGMINGEYMVGGLVGFNESGSINDSRTEGTVSGDYIIGGIAGANGTSGSVKDSSSEANIDGYYMAGGLIGRNLGSVNDCNAAGKVTAREIDTSSTEVQAARVKSFANLYLSIARQPEVLDKLIETVKEMVGEAGDMSSSKVQAARVESFAGLYEAMARQPEMAEELLETAKQLTGEAGDMSSTEVQAARVSSFGTLYKFIVRQPEMMEELLAAAKELTGEAGDMSSAEVQAARVNSFSALYEAMARQPEMAEELLAAAKELTGEAGDMSSAEVQAARVSSFSTLYESIARQPEMMEELLAAAKELTGEARDMSSAEVQAARASSFSTLYESIARQPEMMEELLAAAKELAGEAGDMSSAEVQAARVSSFSTLYESIARQPEMIEELLAAAKELTGEAGDMSSVEVQAARAGSFKGLYTALGRQPEMAEELLEAAKELTGEAGDMASPEIQAARLYGFDELYIALAWMPELKETLTAAAEELTGKAGDMSSNYVQGYRIYSLSALYQAIADHPESKDLLLEVAKELAGEQGDLSSPELQGLRAGSFSNLFASIAEHPSQAGALIDLAGKIAGEAGDLSLPGVQEARMTNSGIIYRIIGENPGLADTILAAVNELTGGKCGWTSAKLQALRAYSMAGLYSSIGMYPENSDLMIEKAEELTGKLEDWVSPKVQAGGLVGVNSGTITSCYATGVVAGRWYIGGISGSNSGLISDSYAVNSKLENLDSIAEGMSSGRIAGINTGTLVRNYASKTMGEPYAGAFEKKDMVHTRRSGGNLASWSINNNGSILAVPEGYSFTAYPERVATDNDFDMLFSLSLSNDTVSRAVYSSDITLGGSFAGLSFASIQATDETTVTVEVYGSLTEAGEGTFTISKEALLLSPEALTAKVEVVPYTASIPVNILSVTSRQEDVCMGNEAEKGIPYYVSGKFRYRLD